MKCTILFRLMVVFALSALVSLFAPRGRAQESVPWTVTVQAFNCPPGMTVETLVGEDCILATDGFDIHIGSLEGIQPRPLTLADATFDGSAFTWDLGTAHPGPGTPPADAGPSWSIGETTLPDGYTDYIAVGETVQPGLTGSHFRFQTTWGVPNVFITFYNFAPPMQPSEEAYAFTIDASNCDAFPPDDSAAVCEPAGGVWFEVTSEGGQVLGSCVTEVTAGMVAGRCTVDLPYDAAVTVTEDEDTVPQGYAPHANPQTAHTPRTAAGGGVPPDVAFVNVLQPATETPTEIPTPGSTVLPNPVVGRPAHIHPGNCGKLRRQNSYDLTDLTVATGDWDGSRRATVAEVSFTTIDATLDDLLATSHAINVHESAEAMSAYIVCGEIGGVRRPDGSVAVGLREVNSSGYEGIAYLTPNGSDSSKTDVWVFVAPKLAQEEQPTPVATPVAATPETSPEAR